MKRQALRWLLGALSGGMTVPRLSVLIYHRVLPAPDPLFPSEPDAAAFEQHMSLLSSFFHVIPLEEAVGRLRSRSLQPRTACVTFDDGYADNAEIALPILQKRGIPATFFIATGFLDGGRMWNDTIIETVRRAPGDLLDLTPAGLGISPIGSLATRRTAIDFLLSALKYLPPAERRARVEQIRELVPVDLPSHLMMRSRQVRALRDAGMGIGGHTVSHPILARLDAAAARSEIAAGKECLEAIIGERVTLFAYPNGKPERDYRTEHVRLLKEIGIAAAVSTAGGAAGYDTDPYQIPRFTPWDRGAGWFALRMARNLVTREAACPTPGEP